MSSKCTKLQQISTFFDTIKKTQFWTNRTPKKMNSLTFNKPFHFVQRFEVAKVFNDTFCGRGFRRFEIYSSTPQIKTIMFRAFNGRLLIDFDEFFDDFERIFVDEYNSQRSAVEIIVNHFGVDAFKMIFALLYTGDDKTFEDDMNDELKQFNQ